MDYSICKALSYNMEDIPVALVMYDIMCQYRVNFKDRIRKSPELSLPSSLELRTGIGLFHIHGHQDSCLPRYSPSFIPGAKQVDGEIIETLWAPLNNISRSLRGMSLAHRQEVLDAHMNHSNWKKLVRIGMYHLGAWNSYGSHYFNKIVPSLLKRWKRLDSGSELSAEAFVTLSKRFKEKTKGWLKADNATQQTRHRKPEAMDIYDTAKEKGMRNLLFPQFNYPL
jgi:Kyakuja-Dileera-Zisupton transposase